MRYFLSAFFNAMPSVLAVGRDRPQYISIRESNFQTDREKLAADANRVLAQLQHNAKIAEVGYVK